MEKAQGQSFPSNKNLSQKNKDYTDLLHVSIDENNREVHKKITSKVGYTQRDYTVNDADWDLTDHDGAGNSDDAWNDLDFGPNGLDIIPLNTKAIVLALGLRHVDTNEILRLRTNGETSTLSSQLMASVRVQTSQIFINGTVTIGCDSNGVIEYWVSEDAAAFTITVIGWFI